MDTIQFLIVAAMITLCGVQAALIAHDPRPVVVGSAVATFGFTAFTILRMVRR